MPLDDRVKGALERSTSVVDPDVRRDLATVRRRTSRLVLRQRVGGAALVVALIASAVFLGPGIVDVIRNQRNEPADRPTPAPTGTLPGSYRVDLSGADGRLVSAGLDGEWTLTFNSDGALLWNAPASAGISEGLPRDTYQMSGDRIVTTAFVPELCEGAVGTYTWKRTGSSLSLRVVDDACELRAAVLTSEPWSAG